MNTATVQLMRRWGLTVVAGLGVILALTSPPASAQTSSPGAEWDGLKLVESKKLDKVYLQPGIELGHYTSVKLDPIMVQYSKDFNPNQNRRGPRVVSDEYLEEVKNTLATEFKTIFTDRLTKNGYMVVDEDGDNTLRVSAAIVNLYITSPEPLTSGRTTTFVEHSGHMSLVAELRDSVSNNLLARVIDTERGRQTGDFNVATSVGNLGDARTGLTNWANVLVEALNDAKNAARTRTASSP